MKTWYSITPVDTLFLRGAEPMEAGQPSREALFPPPVSVIAGALRTAVLKQKGITFADYKAGKCPKEVSEAIGPCSGSAPFQIGAVLLAWGDAVYAPCPAHCFADSAELKEYRKKTEGKQTTLNIHRAVPLSKEAAALFLHSSAGADLPLVHDMLDPKPLAGCWLRLDCLGKAKLAAGELLAASDLYDVEVRTGIAVDEKRKVREGAIYSATHIRLRPDVHLVIGLDRAPDLTDKGTLALGGEQRLCGYKRCKGPDLPQADGSAGLYLALAPVELTEAVLPYVFAAAKPVTLAGWDLAKGFHKATTTWLSAGTVFTENINTLCIPLAQ